MVAPSNGPIVITKHGKPITQLTPIPAQSGSLFGYMKDTSVIKGDIVGSGHEAARKNDGLLVSPISV
jgi:antitoxin (DNA-binding transcriptional repressor) of toxin-antitoxin stability system